MTTHRRPCSVSTACTTPTPPSPQRRAVRHVRSSLRRSSAGTSLGHRRRNGPRWQQRSPTRSRHLRACSGDTRRWCRWDCDANRSAPPCGCSTPSRPPVPASAAELADTLRSNSCPAVRRMPGLSRCGDLVGVVGHRSLLGGNRRRPSDTRRGSCACGGPVTARAGRLFMRPAGFERHHDRPRGPQTVRVRPTR